MDELACEISVWFVAFSECLAFLAVGSSSLNRQDAKNAKVGFTELRRRCVVTKR
jgi:hypothetical protein